jgi:hypothetical protein
MGAHRSAMGLLEVRSPNVPQTLLKATVLFAADLW